tara:strand:+ start:55 stop:477 length:423 start_codon:yes stop_codon:yes gene_type:complete
MNKNKWKNHSTKGYVGQGIVEIDLLKRGYGVYRPLVDDDGVDLLIENKAIDNSQFTTLQVKYSESYDSHSSIKLDVKKSRADYIALVCEDIQGSEIVLYIENKNKKGRWTRNIQMGMSKNNQKIGIHNYKQYLKPRFLKQ